MPTVARRSLLKGIVSMPFGKSVHHIFMGFFLNCPPLSLTELVISWTQCPMPNPVPGPKGKSWLVEVISVPTVAVARASASVWLVAFCPAAPPSGLPGALARGHEASVLLLPVTGSFLSHKAAPILELNCGFPQPGHRRIRKTMTTSCWGGRV